MLQMRRTLCVLIFFLQIPPELAVADDPSGQETLNHFNAEIDSKKRILMCIQGSRNLLNQYQRDMSLVFDGDSNLKIGGLSEMFARIVKKRHFVWKKYDDFKNMVVSYNPSKIEDFSRDLKEIRAQGSEIVKSLRELQASEQDFLIYSKALKSVLREKNFNLSHLAKEISWNDCDAVNLENPALAAVTNLRSIIAITESMEGFLRTVDCSANIFILMAKMQRWAEIQYETKVIEKFESKALDILAKINQLEALENILINKINFDKDLVINGADNGLYNRFLQFQSSLITIEQKIKAAESILNAIRSFSSVSDISQYEKGMIDSIETLRKEKEKIQSRGHRETLERQSLLNKRRLEITGPEVTHCRSAIEKHLKELESAKNYLDFLEVDSLYLESIKACKK